MGKIAAAFFLVSIGFASAESFDELASQATHAREANDVPRAEILYRQALAQKPDWAEGWFFLGSLAYDADRYADGRDALAHFVKLDEKTASGWSLLGLCEFETGEYQPALEHIRRGLTLGSGIPPELVPVLRFHEAQLLTRGGLFDQALEEYGAILRQGSQNEALFRGLGLAALRSPLLVKEIAGDRERLYSAAGAVVYLWITGQADAAEKSFRGLAARFPDVPQVHCLYGTFLLPSRPDEALLEFKRELDIDPRNPEALALLAKELSERNEAANAFEYAQRAVEAGLAVPVAQYMYGLLLTRRGDVSRGIERLEAAEKLDPQNLEYHLALAEAYSKAGRTADARRERAASIRIAKGDS